MAFPLLAILPALEKVLDRVIPDKATAALAKVELWKLEHEGEFRRAEHELKLVQTQTDTNKVEAGSASFFVAGWRPAVGWVGVLGLSYQFLLQPILSWASTVWGVPVPPALDLGDLITIVSGMLGLGAMRTAEKFKGVAAGLEKPK